MTSTSGTKPMVVKSKRGGRRPGAGRPPGAKNKKPPAPKRAVGKKVFDKNSIMKMRKAVSSRLQKEISAMHEEHRRTSSTML